MEYYENKMDSLHQIDSATFYSRKRRKTAHVTSVIGWVNGAQKVKAYILKYY